MQYALGELLADYGFSFLEQLHNPIFLLNKNGQLKKVNEAGRKLLSVAQVTKEQLDSLAQRMLNSAKVDESVEYLRVNTGCKQLTLVSKHLANSDYFLVEVLR
jgi:sensor histidine kinase regulating citrate/malate metabolism